MPDATSASSIPQWPFTVHAASSAWPASAATARPDGRRARRTADTASTPEATRVEGREAPARHSSRC